MNKRHLLKMAKNSYKEFNKKLRTDLFSDGVLMIMVLTCLHTTTIVLVNKANIK